MSKIVTASDISHGVALPMWITEWNRELSVEEAEKNRMRAASMIVFTPKVEHILLKWSEMALCRTMWALPDSFKHPEVKGDKNPRYNHRHDQSILNIILIKQGLHSKLKGNRSNYRNIRGLTKNRKQNIK